MRIFIFKKRREKLTFRVSNIYYFWNLTFWDWFPLSKWSHLIANHPLFTQNFWSNFFLRFLGGSISPFIKGGGVQGGAHYAHSKNFDRYQQKTGQKHLEMSFSQRKITEVNMYQALRSLDLSRKIFTEKMSFLGIF